MGVGRFDMAIENYQHVHSRTLLEELSFAIYIMLKRSSGSMCDHFILSSLLLTQP